jgi:nucleoside-diphosphate-sugar epimerase
MKVLITGANGFIGSHLIELLQTSGYDVRCLVRSKSPEHAVEGVEYLHGDICKPETLAPAVEGVEIIFHLAGATKARNLEGYLRVNENGTKHLLETAVRHAPNLRRFLLVSSLAAAGPSADGRPLTEDLPPRPISHYGLSKLRAEQAAWGYADRLPVTVVRPPAVYGPRERDIYVYFRQVRRGLLLRPSGGERYLSVIHVKDLVAGLLLAASSDRSHGQTYYLANPEPVAWGELGRLIARSLNAHPLAVSVPVWLVEAISLVAEAVSRVVGRPALLSRDKVREMKQRYWVCDPSKAVRELDFSVQVPLEEGIQETADWYRRHGWL